MEQTETPAPEQADPTQGQSGVYEMDGGTYEGDMVDGQRKRSLFTAIAVIVCKIIQAGQVRRVPLWMEYMN